MVMRDQTVAADAGQSAGASPCCGDAAKVPSSAEAIVGAVRDRYAEIARTSGSCCSPSSVGCSGDASISMGIGYSADDLKAVPEGANLGLGCGAPVAHLALKAGETVLDLGSGAGLDAFLAAREVGPGGRVIGVDMTPDMIDRARENARSAGISNVEFREGRLEALPVADGEVDAVTSNCVINLVPEKADVYREAARALKPGGRIAISDMVLEGDLPESVAKDLYAYAGCISGAMDRRAYFEVVEKAGFEGIEILRDSDYVATVAAVAPAEIEGLLARTGVRMDQILGRVRSITFRARRKAD